MTSPSPSSAERARPYDFRKPRLLSQDQTRMLQEVHEAFGRRLAIFFSAKVRALVEISVSSVEPCTYADYVATSEAPTTLFSAHDAAHDSDMLMEVDPRLALFLVEKLFGGTGAYEPGRRALSLIEQRVVRRLAEHTFAELGPCWAPVPLNLQLSAYEANVQFAQLLPPGAPVVVIRFEACVRDHCAPVVLCYPFDLVRRLLERSEAPSRVKGQPEAIPPPVRAQYEGAVQSTAVELRAELGRTLLPLSELLTLAVGDVITLRRQPAEPLDVYVGQQQRFRAAAGRSGKRCALQIVEAFEPQSLSDDAS